MFAPNTYRPTHSGPFLATGETMRRARNDAQAAGDAQSVSRGFMPMRRGVAAGSLSDSLRSNMMADSQAMQAQAQSMQGYNQMAQDNATANLQYQTNLAREMGGLRDLLFSKESVDYSKQAAAQDRDASRAAFGDEMAAASAQQRMATESAQRRLYSNLLIGLLGGVGLGQSLRGKPKAPPPVGG